MSPETWVKSPLNQNRNQNNGGELKEMGVLTGWLCVPVFWGNSLRFGGQNHTPDRLAQRDGLIPMDGLETILIRIFRFHGSVQLFD